MPTARTLWLAGAALALSAPPTEGASCFSVAQLDQVDVAAASCANCSVCAVSVVPDCDFLLHCRLPSATRASTDGSASYAKAGEYINLATGQDANAVGEFWTTVAAVDQVVLTGGDLKADGLPNATLSAAAMPTASAITGLHTLKFRNLSFATGARLPDLSSLQALTLSGCALTGLPPLIANASLVRGLRTLNLAANALSAIPDAVYALPSLRSLNIERNAISQALLNVSQYEFLSALESLSADVDAFQSSNCDGGGAVVYFASNPEFCVCDPAAYTSSTSSSSSSSSRASSTSISSSGGSQRPALIAGSVAISCGLLVALIAKLLADRKRRRRLKEEQLRTRERETESSHGALATMSPPSTPVAGRDDDTLGRDSEWYHVLHGDPADDALPSVRSLLERCQLESWHRNPALITLDKPMSEFLASESDYDEHRTSTTIVSSSNLSDLWLGRYREERVAVKRVPLCDRVGDVDRLREPALLATLAHPNVLRLRGVSYSSSLGLLVLYELMDRGDLRSYLRSCHGDSSRNSSSSDVEADSARQTSWWGTRRLEIALDVARALLYLHSQRRIAHGALTSRAVLLNHEFAAKLAGFECFQPLLDYSAGPEDAQVEAAAAKNDPREFVSLAPELLTREQATATEATDVYAFGALLLELDAGLRPFEATARRRGWSEQELRQRLASGTDSVAMDELMDVSPGCPAALRILMGSCLSLDPAERPTVAAIVAVLKSVIVAATEQEDALGVAVVKKKKKKRATVSSVGRLSSGRL